MSELKSVINCSESEQLVVKNFSNDSVGSRLMSMGILPGSLITIERIAPLKGGFCLKTLTGQKLALRYQEAKSIMVE